MNNNECDFKDELKIHIDKYAKRKNIRVNRL